MQFVAGVHLHLASTLISKTIVHFSSSGKFVRGIRRTFFLITV